MNLPATRGSALASRASRLPAARSHGSATAIRTQTGGVSAFFALEAFDRRTGIATYSLRVINQTAYGLVCRTWAISRTGEATLASVGVVEIAPRATLETLVPVPAHQYESFVRAIAEVAGEGVHCLVEAPAPVRKKRSLYGWSLASLAGGFIAIVAAVGVDTALPRINAFAVPSEAVAGSTIRAEYVASGAGSLSYSVLAPDGRQLQGGPLSARSGAIPISVPSGADPGAYAVQIVMQDTLGRATETRVLNGVVARQRSGAQIEDISVDPVVVRPGERLNVAYQATGDRGYVRLTGADGTIWAQAPFSRTGAAEFVVPPIGGGQELRVRLHVTKGRSTAESVAGAVIAPTVARAAVPAAAGLAAADDDAAAAGDANSVFKITSTTVHAGNNVEVKILAPRNGMRISLMDLQSHEVAGVQTDGQSDVVTLRAPSVGAPTRYVVEADFTDGFGQESIVEPITIVP